MEVWNWGYVIDFSSAHSWNLSILSSAYEYDTVAVLDKYNHNNNVRITITLVLLRCIVNDNNSSKPPAASSIPEAVAAVSLETGEHFSHWLFYFRISHSFVTWNTVSFVTFEGHKRTMEINLAIAAILVLESKCYCNTQEFPGLIDYT